MVPDQNNSIKTSQTICGSNTGDEVVIDENGDRWLIVSDFSEFRGTGERRGVLKYGAIFEI
jgi:alpha-D-ribose 1-methylphosphonate 5-phosphate C-P lyase